MAWAAADASAAARLMTRWRHHLHLCGEQGCELHKVSRQANQMTEIFRCCADSVDEDFFELTDTQEEMIRGIQQQMR